MADVEPCRMCGASAALAFFGDVPQRRGVAYYECPRCGLLQTETPVWIREAHGDAMAAADTGAIDRNIVQSRVTALLASILAIGADAACLDFGAGHGVLVRMMRDIGLDFRAFDQFAENVFARGFEGEAGTAHRFVTAFEVVEHFADPAAGFAALLGPGHDAVLVSTELRTDEGQGWWYLMPSTGQHVAFYREQTLRFVAQRHGYDVVVASPYAIFLRAGVFSRTKVMSLWAALRSPARLERVARVTPVALVRRLGGFRSRTQQDHEQIIGGIR